MARNRARAASRIGCDDERGKELREVIGVSPERKE